MFPYIVIAVLFLILALLVWGAMIEVDIGTEKVYRPDVPMTAWDWGEKEERKSSTIILPKGSRISDVEIR